MTHRLAGVGLIALYGILLSGCVESIYVDDSNVAGPWDGSESNPFNTITAGLAAADADETDIVWVAAGLYLENVTVKRDNHLKGWGSGQARIRGAAGAPTVTAQGGNEVTDLVIEGGSSGVLIEVDEMMSGAALRQVDVRHCEIRHGDRGITVAAQSPPEVGEGRRPTIKLRFIHNYLHDLDIDGIRLELTGPRVGELRYQLYITENMLIDSGNGIFIRGSGVGAGRNRFVVDGDIKSNVVADSTNGMSLSAENLAIVQLMIGYNTFANNQHHGINAATTAGPDGRGSAHQYLWGNILYANGGVGFQEMTAATSPLEMSHNLFFNNDDGQYADAELGRTLNVEAELNSPVIDGRVVFYSGSGNIVADPLLTRGGFRWMGAVDFGRPGEFFLRQDDEGISPAVDAGGISATEAELQSRSTRTDLTNDEGAVDIGFHYRR